MGGGGEGVKKGMPREVQLPLEVSDGDGAWQGEKRLVSGGRGREVGLDLWEVGGRRRRRR